MEADGTAESGICAADNVVLAAKSVARNAGEPLSATGSDLASVMSDCAPLRAILDTSPLLTRCVDDSRAPARLRVAMSEKFWLAPMIDAPAAVVAGATVDGITGTAVPALTPLALASQASVD